MRFEIGKYYKHTTGTMLHIITAAKTTLYGWTHIAESINGSGKSFMAVGFDTNASTNFSEISEDEWMKAFTP